MASSSSLHQQNQELSAFPGIGEIREVCQSLRLFDVFINHRGPDVKSTLATQLYNSLAQLGIPTFLDSKEKELGTSFPSTIHTAILSAKVHIAIFSKRYAESAWCLAELLLMLQIEAKIIPVFYEVEPWELCHIEKGKYADAFVNHEKKGRYLEKLNQWKEALHTLSFTADEVFKSFSDWDCQKIVAAAQKEVQKKTCLHVAEYPVGLNKLVEGFERRCLAELVQDFENQCELKKGKHKAKIVGIFGMGGLGKTTLAKELFNRKKSNYSSVSFSFDVREAFMRRELPSLQLKLLKDLFNTHHLSFTSIEEGRSYLKDSLRRSPNRLSFLIVIDDIDHVEQLNALRIMDILGRSCNSLIIVTTRDVGVLITAGITVGYNLKGMDRNYGRELFCWHAFGRPHPSSGYEVMVDAFVDVCRGLPLSLLVLGRHVHGRGHRFWESELIKARKTQPQDIKKRLRISFDALDDEEKQVFMDVACFFLLKPRSIAERVLEGSGWNAHNAIETLKDKCLIEKEEITIWVRYEEEIQYEKEIGLRMHDHLRDLGRELAVELRPPHRVWCPQDLKPLELTGFETILAKTNIRCFHSIFDKSLGSKVTFFMGQSNNCFETSGSLLWLQLEGNSREQPSIPSWIPLQNLQYLEIKGGQLKTLWENSRQAPSHLKKLHISQCPALKKVSLGHSSCLERIRIVDFEHLKSVSGISNLAKLVELEISGCGKLEFEYLRLRGMNCLKKIKIDGGVKVKYFELEGCQILREFPDLSGISKDSLENVFLENGGKSSIVKAPMSGLEELEIEISGENFVSQILISGIDYPSLKSIKLHGMENLMEVNLTSVKTINCLDIKTCEKLERFTGTSDLPNLVLLNISRCPELKELSLGHSSCLERITIVDCKHLKSVSGISNLANLVKLEISSCGKLEFEYLRLRGMNCLESIKIAGGVKVKYFELEGCQILKILKFGCEELVELIIRGCPEVKKLPYFISASCLERIIIDGCDIWDLQFKGCQNLRSVSGNFGLTRLTITECRELEELSSLAKQGGEIVIESCEKLQNISGIEEMHAPQYMRLNYCSNEVIRNCIHKLKSVSSLRRTDMIGRAAVGAESSLNENLFNDSYAVTYPVTDAFTDIKWSYRCSSSYHWSSLIGCFLVVVDSSTSVMDINNSLPLFPCETNFVRRVFNYGSPMKVRQGEWIITMVARRFSNLKYVQDYSDVPTTKGIMEGFWVKVKRCEEWEIVGVLRTIVDKLHHL